MEISVFVSMKIVMTRAYPHAENGAKWFVRIDTSGK